MKGSFAKKDVFKKYKFCVVMENTEGARDYVTEKLWHGAFGYLMPESLPLSHSHPNLSLGEYTCSSSPD